MLKNIYVSILFLIVLSIVGCSGIMNESQHGVVTALTAPKTTLEGVDRGHLLAPYLLGSGDLLSVSIWKDEALTRNVTISPDGSFAFPLIGNVQVAGKTLEQLRQELELRLSPFVPDPVLSLELRQVNSVFIFVLGRVNQPGRFALNSRINVLQALAIAGGLNPFANEKKIRIIREGQHSTKIFLFNYRDVTRGNNLESNIMLQRNDVILVP